MATTKTKTDWRARFEAMVENAAEQAWSTYMRNLRPLYLYYSPADQFGKWGELIVSADRPRFVELAANEMIPRNLDRLALYWWIRERCTRLPIVGATD